MTNPLTTYNYNTFSQEDATPPVYGQLRTLFEEIPDDELLKSLKVYYAGRNGYTYQVLWRTYVAMVVLNLPSFAALIRALQNNPYIALACGIVSPNGIPSKFAYSRFMRKLQAKHSEVLVKGIMRKLTHKCYETFPGFGNRVAIDSTDLKAWSNGGKTHKSDPDAGWIVKGGTDGRKKFVYGYKLHLLIDTALEIPIAANLTRGNLADVKQATPLMAQARKSCGFFNPEYVLCDAGYSSGLLRKALRKNYGAWPIIKSRKNDRWIAEETPE